MRAMESSSSNNKKEQDDYDHLFKIVIVGEPAVGKTHIVQRYTKGELPRSVSSTIGVEFATKVVVLSNQ